MTTADYVTSRFKRYGLNDAMEFDHVIQVHPDGTVTDGPAGIYAPEVYPDYYPDGSDYISEPWTLLRGYSGQAVKDRSANAHMHNSEAIGGRMARDILETPGLYAAVVLDWPCDTGYGCDGPDHNSGEPCDADHAEGWVVAYREA